MKTNLHLLFVLFLLSPVVHGQNKVKALAAGISQNCALLESGSVQCWGYNRAGNLGIGDNANRYRPHKLLKFGDEIKVEKMALGAHHACFLLKDGELRCWGLNIHGGLGVGIEEDIFGWFRHQKAHMSHAVDLGTDKKIQKIALGGSHSCVLFEGGAIKCWGGNVMGQLGLGDKKNRGKAKKDMGQALPFVNYGSESPAIDICAGQRHTCIVQKNGEVKCWGYKDVVSVGTKGHIGIGPNQMGENLKAIPLGKHRAKGITCGEAQTCVLFENKRVKCFGPGRYGSLGIGDEFVNTLMNANTMGENLPFLDFGQGFLVETIHCGFGIHCCARLENNSLRCWGANRHGQLGLGDNLSRGGIRPLNQDLSTTQLGAFEVPVDVVVGRFHSCALLQSGKVKCWGSGKYGEVGQKFGMKIGLLPGEMGDALPAISFRSK